MEKDFDRWNEQKKGVQARSDRKLFHEREIWWCALGVNVGSEQDGVRDRFERPVLVVKNFNGKVLWILPLTRTYRARSPYHLIIEETARGPSVAIISQLRLISSKRLIRKMRTMGAEQFKSVLRALNTVLPKG
jgi:mRNA interferase MazF